MKKVIRRSLVLTSVLILLTFFNSCDRPVCQNTNPLFEKFTPDQKEYKDELIKQMKLGDNSNLSYWLHRYKEVDGVKQLYVFIQGNSLCAQLLLTIKQPDENMEDIIKAKGMGYSGAELKGLKFDIIQDSLQTEFLYKSMDSIID